MRQRDVTIVLALVGLGLPSQACASIGGALDRRAPIHAEIDFRLDNPTFFAGGPLPFAFRLKLVVGAPEVSVPSEWHEDVQFTVRPAPRRGAGSAETSVSAEGTAAMTARQRGTHVRLTSQKRGDTAYLVIAPKATKALTAGSFILKAVVDVRARLADGSVRTIHLEQESAFQTVPADTPERIARLSRMISQYQVENAKDIDAAIRTLEKGLRTSGMADINYRLGWLYQSRGDLEEAITRYERYIAWVRGSGVPRDHNRGPQEIAEELEQVIGVLRTRIEDAQAADGQ